jgi:ribosomal protein S21
MVEFKRKKGESFESFLRRYNKAMIQSGKLAEARQRQHRLKKKTKRKQKENALYGMKLKEKRDYLRKTGKLKEDVKLKV